VFFLVDVEEYTDKKGGFVARVVYKTGGRKRPSPSTAARHWREIYEAGVVAVLFDWQRRQSIDPGEGCIVVGRRDAAGDDRWEDPSPRRIVRGLVHSILHRGLADMGDMHQMKQRL
jgi:hypothetical protein